MLTITFKNDGTGDPSWLVGNYDYVVYINNKKIAEGKIENHNRISGWEGLVACLAKLVWKEPE